jgi:biopolymer transport protein ExbB
MYWFDSAYEAVSRFMDMGGNVLWLIAILLFVMWTLIFERVWYFKAGWKNDAGKAIANWESRPERNSWFAHQIREKLISQARMQIYQYLPVIKTMVALCPLLGLLGTVTGMIEVFDVMAVAGSGNAKAMAGGVSKATIPTMAGMVAALSGLILSARLELYAADEGERLADRLEIEHGGNE